MADDTPIRVPSALVEGFDGFEVGVRPEKIKLSELTDPVPDGVNQLQGVIRDASYLGVSTSYIVDTRGGGSVTVYEQNVERATRAELWRPGEDVRLTWLPDHTFAVEGSAPPVAAGRGRRAARRGRSRRRPRWSRAAGSSSAARSPSARSGSWPSWPTRTTAATAVVPPSPSGAASPTPLPSVGPSASAGPATPPPNQVATGPLKFANWPAYIDQATEADQATGVLPAGSSKTLVDFTKKYGVEVDYEEKIGDNATFVQTITPALVGGLPTGWDLMVLTDWMAGKIIAKKWAEQIIKANVPELRRQPARAPAERVLGPGQRLPLPVAVRA